MSNASRNNAPPVDGGGQPGCCVALFVFLLRAGMIAFILWICYEGRLNSLWADWYRDPKCDLAANIHVWAMIILGCLIWKKLPPFLEMVHAENRSPARAVTMVSCGVSLLIALCFVLTGIPVWMLMEYPSLTLCLAVIIFFMPGGF